MNFATWKSLRVQDVAGRTPTVFKGVESFSSSIPDLALDVGDLDSGPLLKLAAPPIPPQVVDVSGRKWLQSRRGV